LHWESNFFRQWHKWLILQVVIQLTEGSFYELSSIRLRSFFVPMPHKTLPAKRPLILLQSLAWCPRHLS